MQLDDCHGGGAARTQSCHVGPSRACTNGAGAIESYSPRTSARRPTWDVGKASEAAAKAAVEAQRALQVGLARRGRRESPWPFRKLSCGAWAVSLAGLVRLAGPALRAGRRPRARGPTRQRRRRQPGPLGIALASIALRWRSGSRSRSCSCRGLRGWPGGRWRFGSPRSGGRGRAKRRRRWRRRRRRRGAAVPSLGLPGRLPPPQRCREHDKMQLIPARLGASSRGYLLARRAGPGRRARGAVSRCCAARW